MRIVPQMALSTVAAPFSARPCQESVNGVGARQLSQACCRIAMLATMISTPSTTAAKNSAF